MTVSRAELQAALDVVRATLTAAGTGAVDAWNAAVSRLLGDTHEDDREWLTDRMSDLGYAFGVPGFEDAQNTRRLDAEGRSSWDHEPEAGPRPFFAAYGVRPGAGSGHGAAGFDELAAGGGQGPWTWGYDEDQRAVWFSDARPGASERNVREGLAVLEGELRRLGLEFDRPAKAVGA